MVAEFVPGGWETTSWRWIWAANVVGAIFVVVEIVGGLGFFALGFGKEMMIGAGEMSFL